MVSPDLGLPLTSIFRNKGTVSSSLHFVFENNTCMWERWSAMSFSLSLPHLGSELSSSGLTYAWTISKQFTIKVLQQIIHPPSLVVNLPSASHTFMGPMSNGNTKSCLIKAHHSGKSPSNVGKKCRWKKLVAAGPAMQRPALCVTLAPSFLFQCNFKSLSSSSSSHLGNMSCVYSYEWNSKFYTFARCLRSESGHHNTNAAKWN